MAPSSGGVLHRVKELEDEVGELQRLREVDAKKIALLEEQVHGERGLGAAIVAVDEKTNKVTKAAYWVGGIIVASSIGFAFGVLALVPG